MWESRRRNERRAYTGLAKIQFGIGSLPRDCTIVDISDGGIRMIAENLDVPSEFTVLFAEGRRQCRLAWRIGCEFGAQFIDQQPKFSG
jgi:PilZ domain-containing protein